MPRRTLVVGLAALAFLSGAAHAGRIVVNHDEWTLSNSGYSAAGGTNAQQFATNLAGFMNINGGAFNVLIFSGNFGLTGTSLSTTLTGLGATVTASTLPGTWTAGLGGYDAVFVGGNTPPGDYADDLTDYVNAGGSVYIAAGTGAGGAAAEAALWNGFLNTFGLSLGSPYNGCCGNDPTDGGHALLAGVTQLFYNNGNTVSTTGGNPFAEIIETRPIAGAPSIGLIGVYDNVDETPGLPEPGSLALLGLGLAGLALARRRETT